MSTRDHLSDPTQGKSPAFSNNTSDQGEDDIKSFMSQGDIECLSFWRDTLEESCFFLNDDKDEKIQQQQESNNHREQSGIDHGSIWNDAFCIE